MRNRNNRPRSIFDAIFGSNDFFSESFFSDSFFSMSDTGNSFPEDGDPNFHKSEENVETPTHIITKETWVSTDGTQKFQRTTSKSKQAAKTLKEPNREDIQKLLDQAVQDQDFEKAIELRDKLKKLNKGE